MMIDDTGSRDGSPGRRGESIVDAATVWHDVIAWEDEAMTPHWLLLYDFVRDYLERRGEYRTAHFEHAQAHLDRGELVMAGAFADPADGAVLAFRTDDKSIVESFAENDPYVRNGLVTRWRVRRWVMVVGDGAEAP